MDRKTLERNGIYFEEKVNETKIELLPAHVRSLRNAALDFDFTILDRLSCDTDGDLDLLEEEGNDDIKILAERDMLFDTLRACSEAIEEARRLTAGADREREWVEHYVNWFLDPLYKASQVRDEDSRVIARAKFYYDYFDRASERRWTLFRSQNSLRVRCKGLTEPKPDWAAYFPIYNFTAGDRIPTSRRWRWQNSPKGCMVQNFSRQTLQALAEHGLQPSAAAIFRRGRRDPIALSDCVCYPWLIVEHKKSGENGKDIFCYCQAANAGMAALMMFQILAKYADKRAHDEHIPPVITITTIQSEVRVWVMYVGEEGKTYEMKCIWTGVMTSRVDHLKLKAILENCHTWAVRVLRPWISGYIDLWRHNTNLESQDPASSSDEMIGQCNVLCRVEASDIEESDDEHPAQKIAISLDAVRDVMIQELGSHHDKIESWLRPLVAFKVDKNSVQSGAINDAVRDTLKEETGSHRDKKEAMPRSSLFNHSGMFGYTGVFGDTGMKTKRSDTRDFGTQTDTASAAQNEEFSRPGEQSGLSSPKENGELIPVRLPIISIEGSGNMTSTSKSPISSDMKEVPHAEEVAHAEDVLDDKDILDETEVSTMSKQQVSSLRPTLPPPSNVKEGSKESEQQNSGLRPALFPFPDAKEGNSRSEKQNSSFLFFGADRTERSRKAEQQNSDLQPFLFRFPNAKDQSSKLGPQSSGRLSLRAKSEEPFDWKTYKDVKFDFECKPRG